MARNLGGDSRLFLTTLFEDGNLAGLTDGQLLERFANRRGDLAERAFAALVDRHGPMVLRACRSILRDDHEAMDAFQATFLVLVLKGRSLWVRDSLGPWLHRVACRAAGRARAASERRRSLERGLVESALVRGGDGDREDLAAAIHEELNHLPERYRVPILLCDLEGRSCEDASRHMGCPVGTIGSRLVRGRERLRDRLARRGLAPAAGSLARALSTEAGAAGMSRGLVESTVRAVLWAGSGKVEAGTSSAASVRLAEDILRSMHMTKLVSVGAATVAAIGLGLLGNWALRPGVGAQVASREVQVAGQARPERDPAERLLFLNDKERLKDFVYVEIGNLRPLINDAKGVRFQSREAILYKDGTARLWGLERKDPVAPAMTHGEPIRELTFFDEANLLITASDGSVKVWDGLTGAFRKELPGQAITPMWLSFAPSSHRFVTFDPARKVATVWDAVTLNIVATVRPVGAERGVALGLSTDGKTLVTFRVGADASVELWDVNSGRSFATLRPPSGGVSGVFASGGKELNKSRVERGSGFWDVVRALAPVAGSSGK